MPDAFVTPVIFKHGLNTNTDGRVVCDVQPSIASGGHFLCVNSNISSNSIRVFVGCNSETGTITLLRNGVSVASSTSSTLNYTITLAGDYDISINNPAKLIISITVSRTTDFASLKELLSSKPILDYIDLTTLPTVSTTVHTVFDINSINCRNIFGTSRFRDIVVKMSNILDTSLGHASGVYNGLGFAGSLAYDITEPTNLVPPSIARYITVGDNAEFYNRNMAFAGRSIAALTFLGSNIIDYSIRLENNNLESLDLSNFTLNTGRTYLQEIDLHNNRLTSLSLPDFSVLSFRADNNQLSAITNLHRVTGSVDIGNNNFTTLDMSTINATTVTCSRNRITSLVANGPNLLYLYCDTCLLSSLTVTSSLLWLQCLCNQLEYLSLPASIARCFCQQNALESIALPATLNACLVFNAHTNHLTQLAVDEILTKLAANAITNGFAYLDRGTNAAPSATGLAAKATLEGRGWTVLVNL